MLEVRQFGAHPLYFDGHTVGVVENPARQSQFLGEAVDEWPKAHALHVTANANRTALDGGFRFAKPTLDSALRQAIGE